MRLAEEGGPHGTGVSRFGGEVMICKRSTVPLIFRERESGHCSFQLIGDTYIHGIMRGEAFQADKCYEMHIS